MFRVYLRFWLLALVILVALTTLLILITPQLNTSAPLVYQQFERGSGRYLIYHDPFRNIRWTTRNPAHQDTGDYMANTRSPDGQHYVAPRPTISGVDLFVIAADRSWQRQLTRFQDFPPIYGSYDMMRSNTHPLWSPDGKWVAFISSDLNGSMDIFIIRPDGQDLRLVAHDVGTPVPLGLRWVHILPKDIPMASGWFSRF